MEGSGAPFAVCPRCKSFVMGPPPCAVCEFTPWVPGYVVRVPVAPAPAFVPEVEPTLPWVTNKWWRRTRWGLMLTTVGLILAWIPYVSAISILLLSFGSTFLFLGARGAGRRHEVLVVLAFLLLAIGGILVALFVASFLLHAYNAAGRPLSELQETARLLNWGTLPATCLVAGGFALQVVALLPARQRWLLLGLAVLLAATATVATFLSDPEVNTLGSAPIRFGSVADFLTRLSFYRMLEAPAYVGLGVLYLTIHETVGVHGLRVDSAPIAASPGKG